MDERFEKRQEAGGEEAHFDTPKNKSTWRDRFTAKFRSRFSDEAIKDTPEQGPIKPVSTLEFLKGIFKEDALVTRPQSWIEEAFAGREAAQDTSPETQESKISALDEKTRTEFYMVVAERFRSAGERFITMTSSAKEALSAAVETEVPTDQTPLAQSQTESTEASAPPFTFAREMENEAAKKAPRINPAIFENDPSYSEHYRRKEQGYLIDATPKSVLKDGSVTTYVYRPKLRDVLLGGALGGAYVARRKTKQTERKLERTISKQEKEFTNRFDAQQAAIERIKKAANVTEVPPIVKEQSKTAEQLRAVALKIPKAEVSPPQISQATRNKGEAIPQTPKRAHTEKVKEVLPLVKSPVEKSKEEFIRTFERERAEASRPQQKEIKELRFDQLRPAVQQESDAPKKESIRRIEPIERTTPKEIIEQITKKRVADEELSRHAAGSFYAPGQAEAKRSTGRNAPRSRQYVPAINSSHVNGTESIGQAERPPQNQWMSVAVIIVLIIVSIIFIATI